MGEAPMAKPAIYEPSASMDSPFDPEPVTEQPILGSESEPMPESEANFGSEPNSEAEPMVIPVSVVGVDPNPGSCEYCIDGGGGVEVIMMGGA